jgi:hypothetical protein
MHLHSKYLLQNNPGVSAVVIKKLPDVENKGGQHPRSKDEGRMLGECVAIGK